MVGNERETKPLTKGGATPPGRELSDAELDGVAGGIKQEPHPPEKPPGGSKP